MPVDGEQIPISVCKRWDM